MRCKAARGRGERGANEPRAEITKLNHGINNRIGFVVGLGSSCSPLPDPDSTLVGGVQRSNSSRMSVPAAHLPNIIDPNNMARSTDEVGRSTRVRWP